MSTVSIKRARPQSGAHLQSGARHATVTRVTAEGEAWVDWIGNACGAVRAGILRSAGDDSPWGLAAGDAVLLLIPDTGEPVILGKIADRLPSEPAVSDRNPVQLDASIDGRRVVLTAQDEIVLRCGAGSITLTCDGRIVVKGTEIISRSSGANKIKGAMVNIN
jgi:hypothetical protein